MNIRFVVKLNAVILAFVAGTLIPARAEVASSAGRPKPAVYTYPDTRVVDTNSPNWKAELAAKLWPVESAADVRLWPEGKIPFRVHDRPNRVKDSELIYENVLLTDVNTPYFRFYPAKEKGPRPCVVVCPGGGYYFVGVNKEGSEVAEWLNEIGFSAAVLVYRCSGQDQRDGALADAQRAIRLLRSGAAKYAIDPNRIGLIGFSAGANLTVRTATNWRKAIYARVDAADDVSCRPDFQIPVYPWDLLERTSCGNDGCPNGWKGMTIRPDYPIDAETPPAFIVQTLDDFCDPRTATAYDFALRRAGVSSTLKLYQRGGHGYGLRQRDKPSDLWRYELVSWLSAFAPKAAPESKILKNAKIALEVFCQGKKGESVVVLVDKDPERVACARALETAAVELGMMPAIIDLSAYSNFCHDESFLHNDEKYPTDPEFLKSRIFKPAKAAAEAADILICMRSPGLTLTYANLFAVPHMDDICLTGEGRRMEYQYTDMDKWNITPEEIAVIRPRTTWLNEKLKTTGVVRITSPAGTDLSVPMEKGTRWYPILGIAPLYGEVAIVPALGPKTEGVIVIDGSTYRGVRPPKETGRQPLRIVLKNGRAQEITGDSEQVARMKKLDADNEPAGFGLDEVGLVTTPVVDNDAYWTTGRFDNGTHRHDSIHIALGKNVNRKGVVHSNLHMDMDIRRPTVMLDGLVIIKDGAFVDSVVDCR